MLLFKARVNDFHRDARRDVMDIAIGAPTNPVASLGNKRAGDGHDGVVIAIKVDGRRLKLETRERRGVVCTHGGRHKDQAAKRGLAAD